MRITFRPNTSRNRVNESSALLVTVKVWDDSTDPWAAQVPTSLKYRIDCLTTGFQIIDWTSLTADDETSLQITGAQNAIQSDANEVETKQITVKTNDGLSTQTQNTLRYDVVNLYGQT